MNQTPEKLWVAFEKLADTYPHDDGVRLTAHLTRWLIEERRRLNVPIPAILDTVVPRIEQAIALAGHPASERGTPLPRD